VVVVHQEKQNLLIHIYYNHLELIQTFNPKTNIEESFEYLMFDEILFDTRKEMIAFLENEQYTEEDIRELLINE